MLVVTSNWAFADGTLHGGPGRGCVDRFFAGLRRRGLRAGFRRDGAYRPLERIDVVLAGDTCDGLVSGRWTHGHRPWHGGAKAACIAESVAVGSLRRGGRLLAGLSRLARSGLSVPAADRRGRPILGSRHHVAVRVTLLTGDRDAWIERQVHAFGSARRAVAVGSAWSNGLAMIRHGDDLDPLCVSPNRTAADVADRVDGRPSAGERPPSLAESLAVDLVARFGGVLARHGALRPLAPMLTRRVATGRVIDMADHVGAAIDGEAFDAGCRGAVVTAWRQAVASWHREARRQAADGGTGFDCIDPLAAWLDGVPRREERRLPDGFAGGWLEPAVSFENATWPPATARVVLLGHPSSRPSRASAGQCVCLGPAPIHGVEVALLSRGRGVDVAWIDAGRMAARGRTYEPAPAVVAVFDDEEVHATREVDGEDRGGDHGVGEGQSLRGAGLVRVEAFPLGEAGGWAEWVAVEPESAAEVPDAGDRTPRIIDAA